MITQSELKEYLHYNPVAGLFKWVSCPSQKMKNGDAAGSENDGYIIHKI